MTYAPINGLRVLLVEISILIAAFCLALSLMRFVSSWVTRLRWIDWLLAKRWRSVGFGVASALLARALLLPVVGIPEPRVNDEYSYLLMADTFAHFRLANPTPPAWQHFETFHVNLTPTYHSKYPVAQGAALAFGEAIFHQPWVGVYLSTALMCGAICWALQAFVPSGWALLGGLLAVVRMALFSYWMNSYWGGSMAALGGAVALGSVARIFEPDQGGRSRVLLSCAFAAGLMILATSRPYEGLAFSLPLIGYFGYRVIRDRVRRPALLQTSLPLILIGAAGLLATGCYNHATTGNAMLMPYVLNYRTYWPLPFFLGQKENRGLALQDPVFGKFFQATEQEYEYQKTKTASGLLSVERQRFSSDWLFYIGPALSLPVLIGFLSCMRRSRSRIVVLVSLSTMVALAVCIYSMPHYAAPATVAVYVFAVEGLRYLWDHEEYGERAFVVAVCVTVVAVSLARQTGSTAINSQFQYPDHRKLIAERLVNQPGNHLVLVSYDLERHYPGNELVHNRADFGSEKILWARSKGVAKDLELCDAYPDRIFWSATTDDANLSLTALDICQHR